LNTSYLKNSFGLPNPPPPPPPVSETSCTPLLDTHSLLPPFQHRLIGESSQIATDAEICCASFRSKYRLKIVTDGGLKHNNATFGREIILPDQTIIFQGAGPADSPTESESLMRSELFGFVAPMLIIILNIDAHFAGYY
jgi:hypothetical protein